MGTIMVKYLLAILITALYMTNTQAATATVTVNVTDTNATPLTNAKVAVYNISNELIASGQTDMDGNFTFQCTANRSLIAEVTKPGYFFNTQTFVSTDGQIVTVILTPIPPKGCGNEILEQDYLFSIP